MLLPCMLQSNQIRMALLVVRNRIWKTFACYLLQHVNDPNDDVDFTCANTVSNIQKLFERFETTVCISWKQGNIENRLPFQADVEPLKSSRFPLCPYAHQPAAFRESHNCRNISVCSVWTVTWLAVGSEVRHLCPSKRESWFQRKSIHLFFTSHQNERAFQGCVPEWSGSCVTCSKQNVIGVAWAGKNSQLPFQGGVRTYKHFCLAYKPCLYFFICKTWLCLPLFTTW